MTRLMQLARAKALRDAERNLWHLTAHMMAHEKYGLTFETCPVCPRPPQTAPNTEESR